MPISNEQWNQLTTDEKINILRILITGIIETLNVILERDGYPTIVKTFTGD